MAEQRVGTHEEQRPPEALGFEGLSEAETVMGVRFFVAARAGTPEAAHNILTQEIKPADLKVSIEGDYNPILEPISISKRKRFWADNGNPPYNDALDQWRERFTKVINQVTDPTRISAFKSILPDDPALKDKALNEIDQDDAIRLFREYSENKSDIDLFMRRAITNLTKEGVMDPVVLQAHITHLRWVATGFFGQDTALMIGTQILFEAELKNKPLQTVDYLGQSLVRVNNMEPEETEVLEFFKHVGVEWEEEEKRRQPVVQVPDYGDDDLLPGPIENAGTVVPQQSPPPAADARPDGTPQPDEQSAPVVENNPTTPQENPGLDKENIIEYKAGDATDLAKWINNHLKNQTAPNVTFSIPARIGYSYVINALAQGKAKGGTLQIDRQNNAILLKGVQIERKALMATAKATVDITITNNPAGDGIEARLQKYYNENKTANAFGARGRIEDRCAKANATVKTKLNEQIDPKTNPLWSTERILISGDKVHIKFNKPA